MQLRGSQSYQVSSSLLFIYSRDISIANRYYNYNTKIHLLM